MKIVRSRYTRTVQIDETRWYVHNLASESECILDNESVALLDNEHTQDEIASSETLMRLFQMGFFVDSSVDEVACLELERKIATYSFAYGEVGAVIAPTMDCNAKCYYCYENDIRATHYMSENVRDALIKYLKQISNGKKKLMISWFGGEPLLSIDTMSIVSEELINHCDKNGIDYYSIITTNGLLLDDYLDKIKLFKVEDIQVTLDGYEAEHLRRKNFIQKEGAWEKILNGIFNASNSGIHITIRMNFDRHNVEGLKKVCHHLLEDNRWNNNISIYFAPIEPNGIADKNCFSEAEYKAIFEELYQNLADSGYYSNRESAYGLQKKSSPCYGVSLGTTAIDFEGNIYACQHLLCQKGYAIGNIYEGIKITRGVLDWWDGKLPKKCEECSVLPLCQGGCVTKRCLGQEKYICGMIKWNIEIMERLRLSHILSKI